MLFVFEGVDGAGKTTIAKEVSKITGIPYFNCFHNNFRDFVSDGELRGADESYADFALVDLVKQTGIDLILDRSYPSGWVYTQVGVLLPHCKPPLDRILLNAYPGHNEKAAIMWETEFARFGIMFWIRTDVGIAARRTRKNFSPDLIKEITRLYNEYFTKFTRFHLFAFNNMHNLSNGLIAKRCSEIVEIYKGGRYAD